MFSYQPTVNDKSGEIMSAGMTNAAQIAADARINEAQINAEMMQTFGNGIRQGIGDLVSAYVGNQQDKATAKAFGNILEMHGSTMFGENAGQLLDRYKKAPLQEQLQMGTMLMGNPGSWISRANYQQQTANLFPRSGGGGGGYGGGGSQPFMTVP